MQMCIQAGCAGHVIHDDGWIPGQVFLEVFGEQSTDGRAPRRSIEPNYDGYRLTCEGVRAIARRAAIVVFAKNLDYRQDLYIPCMPLGHSNFSLRSYCLLA